MAVESCRLVDMPADDKTSVSAWVDRELLDTLERRARAEGVTRSVLVERLLREASQAHLTFNGEHGSAKLKLIGQVNSKGFTRALDPDHPGVELWECEDSVWPRHFLHVFAEFGEDPDEGASEVWLLCRGDTVEKIDPDAWVNKFKRK